MRVESPMVKRPVQPRLAEIIDSVAERVSTSAIPEASDSGNISSAQPRTKCICLCPQLNYLLPLTENFQANQNF